MKGMYVSLDLRLTRAEELRGLKVGDQLAIARQLNRYSDTLISTNVWMYQNYPASLRALRLLMPPEGGAVQTQSPDGLLLRYRSDGRATRPSPPRPEDTPSRSTSSSGACAMGFVWRGLNRSAARLRLTSTAAR